MPPRIHRAPLPEKPFLVLPQSWQTIPHLAVRRLWKESPRFEVSSQNPEARLTLSDIPQARRAERR
jgi:hypothetical protein